MRTTKQKYLLEATISLIYLVFFMFALNYENASRQRMICLIIFFSCLIVCNIIKIFIQNKSFYYILIFILQTALVFLLEYNSRFVVNYFLHIFYIIISIQIVLYLNIKSAFFPGIIAIIASMIKYILWIRIESNYQNISQMSMFLLLSILLFIVSVFLKTYNLEKQRIKELYDTLLITNQKLNKQIHKVEELTKSAERTSVARELHDSLGHELTGLIVQCEMVLQLSKNENTSKEFTSFLMQICDSARKSLKSVREIVETLRENNIDKFYKKSISELIEKFKNNTGVQVNFEENNEDFVLTPLQNAVIYRTVQESMTNALRHGKANRIDIILKVLQNIIELKIKDNGIGTEKIIEGYGLKGMKERILSLNGTVDLNSKHGFSIDVKIPMEGIKFDKSINS